MTVLSYDEWKAQVGIVENKQDILHLTEQAHGKDAREVVEEYLQKMYNDYVSQTQGE